MAALLAIPASDTLSLIFLLCFLVGFLFVAASSVLGIAGAGGDHGGHFVAGTTADGGHFSVGDGGHAGHLAADAPAGGAADAHSGGHHHGGLHSWLAPLNLTTIMTFLTWFGGVGFVLRTQFAVAALASLATAALAGVVGAAVVFYLLARLLLPGQRALDPRDYRLPGTLARVTTSIREGGIGEIVYTKGGTRRTDGARSVDGNAIARGTDVVILRYEGGLAHVQRWDELLQEAAEGKGQLMTR